MTIQFQPISHDLHICRCWCRPRPILHDLHICWCWCQPPSPGSPCSSSSDDGPQSSVVMPTRLSNISGLPYPSHCRNHGDCPATSIRYYMFIIPDLFFAWCYMHKFKWVLTNSRCRYSYFEACNNLNLKMLDVYCVEFLKRRKVRLQSRF